MKGGAFSTPPYVALQPCLLLLSQLLFKRGFVERQKFRDPFTNLGFRHQIISKLASKRVLEYIQEAARGNSNSNTK